MRNLGVLGLLTNELRILKGEKVLCLLSSTLWFTGQKFHWTFTREIYKVKKCINLVMDLIEALKKEGFRRKLRHRTIVSYCFYFKKFLLFCGKEDSRKFTKKDVKDYINDVASRNCSGNTINVCLNSILFVLYNVLNKQWKLNIKFSKKSKKIPTMLSFEEVQDLINAIPNNKHRLMIMLLYGAGLRVGELVNLRVCDFEFDNNYGWVRDGKGGKDRIFIIAKNIKKIITNYIQYHGLENNNYLFSGRNRSHISVESVACIIKKATLKAKINKNVHPHTLRHSFATHIIDLGNDVCTLQSLLGHSSTNTTMIYVHSSTRNMINANSPLEKLKV